MGVKFQYTFEIIKTFSSTLVNTLGQAIGQRFVPHHLEEVLNSPPSGAHASWLLNLILRPEEGSARPKKIHPEIC